MRLRIAVILLVCITTSCGLGTPPVQLKPTPAIVNDSPTATFTPTVSPTSTPTATPTPVYPDIDGYIAAVDTTGGCLSPTVEDWEVLNGLVGEKSSGRIHVTTLHFDAVSLQSTCRGLVFIPSPEGGNGLIYYVPKLTGVAVVEHVHIEERFAEPPALFDYIDVTMSGERCRGKRTEAWLNQQWVLTGLSMPENGKIIASRYSDGFGRWECTSMILLPNEGGGLGKVIYTPENGPMIIADVRIAQDLAERAWLNPVHLVPTPAPEWSERVQ